MSSRALAVVVLIGAAVGCAPTPPPLRHVADVKQLMKSVLDPAADLYWDAVGTVTDQTGTTEIAPDTTEDWDALVSSAYVIAESGNLLMLGTRPKDGGDWMRMSRSLVDAGEKAVRAAQAHDTKAVFDVGAEVYDACTSCHAKYVVEAEKTSGR